MSPINEEQVRENNDYYNLMELSKAILDGKKSLLEPLGMKIHNRDRREFPDLDSSPIHKAIFVSDPRQRKNVLEILINELEFRPDSVFKSDHKYLNVTPAHLAVFKSLDDSFANLLEHKPDLNISSTIIVSDSLAQLWNGTVEDFVNVWKQKNQKVYFSLTTHMKNDLHERAILEIKQKLFEMNEKRFKREKTLKEEFGLSVEQVDLLGSKKEELHMAELAQENVTRLEAMDAQYQTEISDLMKKRDENRENLEIFKTCKYFRTPQEIKSLRTDIEKIRKRKFEPNLDNCSICLEIPNVRMKIMSCQQCGGIFCQPCIVRGDAFAVQDCPLCKVSLDNKPMLRNVFAERCIKSFHSDKNQGYTQNSNE